MAFDFPVGHHPAVHLELQNRILDLDMIQLVVGHLIQTIESIRLVVVAHDHQAPLGTLYAHRCCAVGGFVSAIVARAQLDHGSKDLEFPGQARLQARQQNLPVRLRLAFDVGLTGNTQLVRYTR
ncbi:hypothetical protein B7G54_01455 [Burkholderia puraquae]|uniref:Uncharacterized protein n=1 Tax=Burkholderia puraquae TaxID=1904757 RepID=A0A1X1PPJ1_9BURK|nr:hypothetical protein B7G54_01455 [Burkholderia puraquae]